MDGVLQLDDVEEHLVHESFVVDTRDHEDHTFCGMMCSHSTRPFRCTRKRSYSSRASSAIAAFPSPSHLPDVTPITYSLSGRRSTGR